MGRGEIVEEKEGRVGRGREEGAEAGDTRGKCRDTRGKSRDTRGKSRERGESERRGLGQQVMRAGWLHVTTVMRTLLHKDWCYAKGRAGAGAGAEEGDMVVCTLLTMCCACI